MTNQELRQLRVREETGTAYDYNGDFHALFDLAGIGAGPFNARFLQWINLKLETEYAEIDGAMNALAVANGAPSFSALGTFDASTPEEEPEEEEE